MTAQVKRSNQSGSVHVILIVGIIVIAVATLVAWRVYDRRHKTVASSAATQSSVATQPSVTLSPGTDNASLNSDLNSVNASINLENSDSTSSSSAINDQQSSITVPTN